VIKGSSNIKGKIKDFEGFVEKPKRDNDGNYILGYGIQVDPKIKTSTTREQAEADFEARVRLAEEEISPLITRSLTQDQQDVLVETHYNMGLTKMRKHGIIDLVNAGKDQELAALFKRLNKAEDVDTGKMVAMGNVPDRANFRAEMWTKSMTGEQPSEVAQLQEADSVPATDLVAEVERFAGATDNTLLSDEQLVTEVSRFASPETPSPQAQFELATDISSPEELEQDKKIQAISKEFNVPTDVVAGMLMSESEDTIRLKLASRDTVEKYPKTSQWASNPNNNALLKKTKDYPKRIERVTTKLSEKKPDWQKAIDSNFTRIEDSTVIAQMIFGSVNKNEGIANLRRLDEAMAANSITSPEVEVVKGAVQRLGQTFAQEWDKLSNVPLTNDTTDNIVNILKATYSSAGITAEEAAALMITAAKHPKAYGQFMVESSGAPIVAGVAASAAGSPVAGVASAYSVSSLIAFGGKVREAMEPFRNKKTGQIDYELFWSDPARVARLRTEAITYGLTIGAIETAFQFLGGKFLSKSIPKNPVLGTIATGVGGAASEFAGEAGARTAGQVASGQDVTLKENMVEGVMEAVSGGPMAAAGAGAQAALNYVNPRKGTVKTADTIQKASKANEDVNTLSELKETLKQDTAAQEYPQQISELIDNVTEVIQEMPDDSADMPKAETSTELEASQQMIREKAKTGVISITPSEWETFNAARGVDPFAALEVFSPRTQAAYQNARESDNAIQIPISEYALATEEDPDIDQIVRINGNDYNNLEANELVDAFEKNPLVFFDTDETSDSVEETVEPLIDQPTEIIQDDGPSSLPLNPLDLSSPFANAVEQEAFESFRRRLTRALPKNTDQQLKDDLAQLQLRRFKLRSAISGLPIDQVIERLKFGKTQGKSNATMPTFEKDFFTVALNKEATPISAIHELAHVWLHEMAEDYQMLKDIDLNTAHGDVKAYREAMDAAREVLGLESLDEILAPKNEKVLERLHETFAQTAEDYFMEGKSENSRIARMMDRMRTWLTKHVNALRKLMRKYPTLNINPKTEFIFDALFAATKASEDEVYSMFPEPMFTVSELGPSAAKYMSTLYDARSQAIGETYAKSTFKTMKENDRVFETEYARINKIAENTVDSLPSMNLRNQMFATYEEYAKRGKKGPDPRISYESAKEYFTDGTEKEMEAFKEAVPFFMITGKKKGGISVPDMMSMIGVNSANELRGMLLEANQREELIHAEIERLLQLEAAPLIKSPQEIHNIAENAVNSGGREKVIRDEFKILMEQYPTQFVRATSGLIQTPEALDKVVRDVYKAEAALTVGATPAFKFSSENFLRDMNRLRREAKKAYDKKDFETAIARKVQEAKAYFAYRESRNAEKALAKSRLQVKNLSKVINNKALFKNSYDYDIVAHAVATVAAVRSGQEVTPLTLENLPENANISQTTMDAINEVTSKLVGEPGGDNLTVNGAVALGNTVKALLKAAREAKELKLKDATIDLDEAVNSDLELMGGDGNVVAYSLAGQDGASVFASAKTSNTKMRAALDQMYKSTEDFARSNLGKIFAWIGSGEAASDIWKAEKRKELRSIMNSFPRGKTESIIASDRFDWMPFIDQSDSAIFWDDKGLKFEGMGELMVAMLYMGSESGAKKFLYGKGLATKVDFNTNVQKFWEMIQDKYDKGVVSKEHLQFVKKAWEILEDIHPQIQQVIFETDGYPMGKIEGWKVKTPIGEIQGGYFPVVHSKQISIDNFTKLLDGGSDLIDWVKAFPGKDTKMAFDRTEFYGDVNLNLNALNAYIEAASNVIHLRKPLVAFSKYVHHPSFIQAIETRRPGMYDNMIKPWMERVKLQSYVDPSSKYNGLNSTIKGFRQNTNISFFLGNLASIFRQFLGSFQALPEIGPLYIADAASDIAMSPITSFKKAVELSPVMKDRMYSSQTKFVSVVEDLNRANDAITKGKEGIEKLTYLPLQAAQNMTDLLVWTAAFNKMKAREESIETAVAYADNVVKKTQGSSNISEMPNLQYGSEVTKWFTQFSTVPLINYELVSEEVIRGRKNTPQTAFAVSMAMTTAILMPIAVDALVGRAWKDIFKGEDEEDEKDKDTVSMLIMKRGSGAMLESYAPTVGRLAGSLISYGQVSFSPSARKIEDNTEKAFEGIKERYKYGTPYTPAQVRGISEVATILMGLPFSLYGKNEVDNYNNLSQNEKRILKMDRSIQRRQAKYEQGEF
jgi:GH24 family phage-related lysozyme (muramidase)